MPRKRFPDLLASDDSDSPWKEILQRLFPEFMAFFFPDAHANIDWSRGYTFLDKELQKVTRDAKLGRRLVDKLAKVYRLDGAETWVMVHIEIQGQPEDEFAHRMYVYNYRLFDRYAQQVASFALLTDTDEAWRPSEFGYALWGTEVRLRFATAKLLDYETHWAELETNPNPFALIVMAHLKANVTKRQPKTRLEWRLRIVRQLYERGLSRETILELFRFLDWIMRLPEDLELEVDKERDLIERENSMPYLSGFERRAIARGLEQGSVKASQKNLLTILEARFGAVPDALTQQIAELQEEIILSSLIRRAATATTLAEFEEGLTS